MSATSNDRTGVTTALRNASTKTVDSGYAAAVAEEVRSHDDIVALTELEIAPAFTPDELNFSDYCWGRGDHRSQRDIALHEAGHGARDFF